MRKKIFSLTALVLFIITGCAGKEQPASNKSDSKARELVQKSYESASGGKFDAAIAYATEAISLNPALVNAYINRSWAHSEKGNYEKAIHDSDKALSLSPDNALAINNKGLAYQRQGNFEQARA